MTRKELAEAIESQVAKVIASPREWGDDPQINIIPTTLLVGIERHGDADLAVAYSDYAIEEDAAADGDYSESAADFQSASDPDLYPVASLIDYTKRVPDTEKINRLAAKYIPPRAENLYAE